MSKVALQSTFSHFGLPADPHPCQPVNHVPGHMLQTGDFSSFVRHVERYWICSICFDMSKGRKNRSTATFDISKQRSMLLLWTGFSEVGHFVILWTSTEIALIRTIFHP